MLVLYIDLYTKLGISMLVVKETMSGFIRTSRILSMQQSSQILVTLPSYLKIIG